MKLRYALVTAALALVLGYWVGNYHVSHLSVQGDLPNQIGGKLKVEPARRPLPKIEKPEADDEILLLGRRDAVAAWTALGTARGTLADKAWKELRARLYDQTFPQYTPRRREQLAVWNDPHGRAQMALMQAWSLDPTGQRAIAVADKLEGKAGLYELLASSRVAGTWAATAEFNSGVPGLSPEERGRNVGVVMHQWVQDGGASAGAAWLAGRAGDRWLDEARLNVFVADPSQRSTLDQIADPAMRRLAVAVSQAYTSR